MKIAVISTFLTDYSTELVRGFAQDAEVLFIFDVDKANRELDVKALADLPSRIRVRHIRQSRIWWRWLAVLICYWELLRFRPDVAIGHEHAHPHVTLIYRFAARLAPFALVVHDPEPHTGRDADFQQRNAAQTRRQRAIASTMFAHGSFCAERLRTVLPDRPDRVMSIPLGANFAPGTTVPVPHSRRILMFGRMEAYKGLDLLLAAATELRRRRDDFLLVLAGRGPLLDLYRSQFEALGCCEIHAEYISREQSIALFNSCDVVVAPYHEATQSGVVSLANAFARPVIGMAVGGLPDVIFDGVNGRLVRPGDHMSLAAALERALYTPGELDRLSEGARSIFTTRLSNKIIAEAILAVFKASRKV